MRGFTPPPQTLNDAPCPPFTSHGASLAMLRAVRWQYNPVTPEHQVFCDALACIKANILFKPVDRTDFMAGYEQVSRRAQLTKTLARSTDKNAPLSQAIIDEELLSQRGGVWKLRWDQPEWVLYNNELEGVYDPPVSDDERPRAVGARA
jgi:hypothetical protein